jgi:hypothetical protein
VRKPSTANAAKKKYVPPLGIVLSMSGDTTPMILQRSAGCPVPVKVKVAHKLLIQVHEVVIETPVDRVARLKISLGRTQPMGAQLKLKKTS